MGYTVTAPEEVIAQDEVLLDAFKKCWNEQETCDPNEMAEVSDRYSLIREIVGTLTQRQQEVVTLYFGLDGGESCTYRKVGEVLHIRPSRVGDILFVAMRKLRRPSLSKRVRAYWR